MADISTFPQVRNVLVAGSNVQTFIAGATIKAAQIVAFHETGVSNTLHPAVRGVTAMIAGVALYDAAVGALIAVACRGCKAKVVNADASTAIDAGSQIGDDYNAIGGTVSITEGTVYSAGQTKQDIPGGGIGIIDVAPSSTLGATGRGDTLLVAANDSPALSKQQADYVCDGSGDQVTIQSAIDELPNTGGKIALHGIFSTNGTIHMYRDVAEWFNLFLEGEGLHATKIVLASGSNCDMIDNEVLNNDSGWKGISDLTLDGNSALQSSGHGVHSFQTGTGNLYDMRFNNVFACSMKQNGFHLENAWGVYLNNCLAEFCGGVGLSLQGDESYCYGFHSSENGSHGIELEGSQLHLVDSRISNVDDGIRIGSVQKSLISNNIITNFGKVGGERIGIYIVGTCSGNNIHNNIIIGDGAQSAFGILYEGTQTVYDNIHNNIIDQCTDFSMKISTEAAKHCYMHDNTITNPPADAFIFTSYANLKHIVTNNPGINPRGVCSAFDNTNYKVAPYNRDALAAAPTTASQDYECVIMPCRIISSGGAGVSIVIKDVAGTTIASPGAACDTELEIGWKINFGGFSSAPTVLVAFK